MPVSSRLSLSRRRFARTRSGATQGSGWSEPRGSGRSALVDDPGGSSVELAWDGRERSVRIDGEPTLAGVPELERLGAERHATYVVTAARLDGSIWEVFVAPL